MTEAELQVYHVGNRVRKVGGDYQFNGWVVSVFQKRSGVWRYVIENKKGVLFIMNAGQLALRK